MVHDSVKLFTRAGGFLLIMMGLLVLEACGTPLSLQDDNTQKYGTTKRLSLIRPRALTIDGAWAYFAERGGTVKRVSIHGGGVTTLTSGLMNPIPISNKERIPSSYTLKVTKEQQLTSTSVVSEYPISWSPDGKYIAATIFAGKWGSDIHMEIIPVKGGERRRHGFRQPQGSQAN